MSQRLLFDEDAQWPATIMRALIWAGTMAAFWAAPFVVFIGFFAAMFYSADKTKLNECAWLFILCLVFFAGIPAILGGITGFVAAFHASSSETYWGPRSPTFCAFGTDMILCMLLVVPFAMLVFSTQIIPLGVAAFTVGFLYSLRGTCARNKQNAA